MKRRAWTVPVVALLVMLCGSRQRGVLVPAQPGREPAGPFDPAQSAALLVGMRTFQHGIDEVPYAVDDAIDLAYTLSIGAHCRLVPPSNVVLVLSGKPQKDSSRTRLRELREAHATIDTRATAANVLDRLKKQSKAAGANGLLIVSFATHGFTRDGVPRVLTADSMLDSPEMTLTVARVLDTTSASKARRSLVFFDACRERATGTRALVPDPFTAAPLLERMTRIRGQIVFFAAQPGGYTGDDPVTRNGVFTGAIVEALQCRAPTDAQHFVTAATLRDYVDGEVLNWVREHVDRQATSAIQVSFEGDTLQMPLAHCSGPTPPVEQPTSAPAETGIRKVVIDNLFRQSTREKVVLSDDAASSHVTIFAGDGATLGTYTYPALIGDLTIDRPTARHRKRILLFTGRTVIALDPRNVTPLWRGETDTPVVSLEVVDRDNDGVREIGVTTATGTVYVNFDGATVKASDTARFELK